MSDEKHFQRIREGVAEVVRLAKEESAEKAAEAFVVLVDEIGETGRIDLVMNTYSECIKQAAPAMSTEKYMALASACAKLPSYSAILGNILSNEERKRGGLTRVDSDELPYWIRVKVKP